MYIGSYGFHYNQWRLGIWMQKTIQYRLASNNHYIVVGLVFNDGNNVKKRCSTIIELNQPICIHTDQKMLFHGKVYDRYRQWYVPKHIH
jgi:hypothetical protein